jgi:sugar lactone lactonase YvrE
LLQRFFGRRSERLFIREVRLITTQYPETVLEGLNLPECPRWFEAALYFSDIRRGRVYRLRGAHPPEILFETAEDFVGGLGFLEDGDLIAVLSKGRRIVRIDPEGAVEHADLSGLCRFVLNDMISANGRAYVSQPGHDIWTSEQHGMPEPTELLMADADGKAMIAAGQMMGPNGIAVSPDGKTLYVAESSAMRVSAFTIDRVSGVLSDQRVFATLPDGAIPDGICLDDSGAVWAAAPVSYNAGVVSSGPGVLRIDPQGRTTHRVPMQPGRRALACAFGGSDRSTLYICTVPDFEGSAAGSEGEGRIEKVTLDVVGAGSP